jgi:hypothetical protein
MYTCTRLRGASAKAGTLAFSNLIIAFSLPDV